MVMMSNLCCNSIRYSSTTTNFKTKLLQFQFIIEIWFSMDSGMESE